MSAALDDIWDAPAETHMRALTPAAPPIDLDDLPGPSPAKRRRTTLFLSDDEDDSPRNPSQRLLHTASGLNPEISALFDDLDPEPELAPSLDLDELRRQAAARHAARIPTFTPREILPSSSPPRDLEDGEGGGETGKKGAADGEKGKRKQLPKLNEARLLAPDGFPALVKHTKDFKPKGKGHEASDLNRLMQVYQFWTHKMYPKNHFRENVQRIEKLCHSRRMMVAMSVWRDESKGLINGRKPGDGAIDLTSDAEQEDSDHEENAPVSERQNGPPSSPASRRSQTSSPPPRPPSSVSGHSSALGDDDIDIDALIQEDAEQQAAALLRQPSPPLNGPTQYRTRPQPNPDPDAMDEDDDVLWSSFNDPSIFDDPSVVKTSTSQATSMASGGGPIDDDEDMWQMLREQEEEEERARAHKRADQKSGAGGKLSSVPSLEERRPTNEEGWDEMYD